MTNQILGAVELGLVYGLMVLGVLHYLSDFENSRFNGGW